jgi:hypothetical protein
MKKILTFVLSTSLVLSSLSVSAAPTLTPPSLHAVMQKNDAYNRTLLRKKRIPNQSGSFENIDLTWKLIHTGKHVQLSAYDRVNLWVQEVDLAGGAHLQSILDLRGYDESTGEPLFAKKKLSEVTDSLRGKPFSIINWQFFDPRREYTPLSFGLKVDGIVRTAWADNRDESKNILIISATGARIAPYSWENLRDAEGYFAMVNFSMSERHHPEEQIGRTYICLKNPDRDNRSSTILIFTALAMSESDLEKEFPRWWCASSAVAKLDSSGSTRLWVDGEYIYGKSHKWDPDYRKIPHYIVVWDE